MDTIFKLLNINEISSGRLIATAIISIIWIACWIVYKKSRALLSLALLLLILRRLFIFISIPGSISNYNNIVFFNSDAYIIALKVLGGAVLYLVLGVISNSDRIKLNFNALFGIARFIFSIASIVLIALLFDANDRLFLLVYLFAALKLLIISPLLPIVIAFLFILGIFKIHYFKIKYILIFTGVCGIYQMGYQGLNLFDIKNDVTTNRNMEKIKNKNNLTAYSYKYLDNGKYLALWLKEIDKINDLGINSIEIEVLKSEVGQLSRIIDELSGINYLYKSIFTQALVFYTFLFFAVLLILSFLIRRTDFLTHWYMLRRCRFSDELAIRSMLFLNLDQYLTDGESYFLSNSEFNDIKEKAVSSDKVSESQRIKFCQNEDKFIRNTAFKKVDLNKISRLHAITLAHSRYVDVRNFIVDAKSLPVKKLIELCFDKEATVRKSAFNVAEKNKCITDNLFSRFIGSSFRDVRDNILNIVDLNKISRLDATAFAHSRYVEVRNFIIGAKSLPINELIELCFDKDASVRNNAFSTAGKNKYITDNLFNRFVHSIFQDVRDNIININVLDKRYLTILCTDKIEEIRKKAFDQLIKKQDISSELVYLSKSEFKDVRLTTIKSGKLPRERILEICKKEKSDDLSKIAFELLKNISGKEFLSLRYSKNYDIRVEVIKSGYLSKTHLYLSSFFGCEKIRRCSKEVINKLSKLSAQKRISLKNRKNQ